MPYREALETVLRRCEPLRLRVVDLEHALHVRPTVAFVDTPASTEAALEEERVLRARLEELERHHGAALARARADEEDGLAAHVTRSVDLGAESATVVMRVRQSFPTTTLVLLILLVLAGCGFVAVYAVFHQRL